MESNIVTFENNKYKWKDIPEYGKCLVPYNHIDSFKVGTIFSYYFAGDKFISIIAEVNPNNYSIVALSLPFPGNIRQSAKSIEELRGYIKKLYIDVNELENIYSKSLL